MEFANRLERLTTARFDVQPSSTGTLNKVVLTDAKTGYRQFVHILADKGRVGIDRAKEELAIDFITGTGAKYADEIKQHKNEPFGGRRSRRRLYEN